MDHILVGVLTPAAAGCVIWTERNSRHNTARQNATKPQEAEG